jgi:hypothetical protein
MAGERWRLSLNERLRMQARQGAAIKEKSNSHRIKKEDEKEEGGF